MWTATRYTYLSLPFFAILVAVAAGWVHHHAVRLNRYAAHALAAVALHRRRRAVRAGRRSTRRSRSCAIRRAGSCLPTTCARNTRWSPPAPPSTSSTMRVSGPNPYWQPGWMLSVGRALYGKDVSVRAVTSADFERLQRSLSSAPYLVELQQGRLERVTPAMVKGE